MYDYKNAACSFVRDNYGPNVMTLSVISHFTLDKALKKLTDTFGSLNKTVVKKEIINPFPKENSQ
jgi:predicted Zn-dependent peptidase